MIEMLQYGGHGERPRVHAQLAGLDLGEVQDVVDDVQKVVARLADVPEHGELARFQRFLFQQLREAQHGVHRRPDLMAHVGQEGRLGLIGAFRLLLGDAQLLLHPLAFRDIAGHAPHLDLAGRLIQPEGHDDLRRDRVSILVGVFHLVDIGMARGDLAGEQRGGPLLQQRLQLAGGFRRQECADGLPQVFCRRIAGHRLDRRADIGESQRLQVEHPDHIPHALGDEAVFPFALAQSRFLLALSGDVAVDADHSPRIPAGIQLDDRRGLHEAYTPVR